MLGMCVLLNIEQQKVQKACERQLSQCLLAILKLANDHKEHIPSITTTDGNPFPYQVIETQEQTDWLGDPNSQCFCLFIWHSSSTSRSPFPRNPSLGVPWSSAYLWQMLLWLTMVIIPHHLLYHAPRPLLYQVVVVVAVIACSKANPASLVTTLLYIIPYFYLYPSPLPLSVVSLVFSLGYASFYSLLPLPIKSFFFFVGKIFIRAIQLLNHCIPILVRWHGRRRESSQ